MPLQHEMILASAGSGKTFQLTNRLIALIRAGVEPSRIIALTFSRNAAAEFLESLMLRLAEAGQSSRKALDLSRFTDAADASPLSTGEVSGLLRVVLHNTHQLHLETLDSFFFQIVNAFPFELGIEGSPSILQGGDVERARREVLRSQLKYEEVDDDRRRAFFEAFKLASYGNDEKRVFSRLQGFINAHYPFFMSHPDESLWGDPKSIGIEGVMSTLLADDDYRKYAEELRRPLQTMVVEGVVTVQQANAFEKFTDSLSAWHVGKFSEIFKLTLPKQVLESASTDGPIVINYGKKSITLAGAQSEKLKRCVRHIIAAECQSRLQATSALYGILHEFAKLYQREVRNAGALTFDDVRMLLVPPSEDAPNRLSLGTGSEAERLFIDYRLDACFDHWLLDEFQDTSREQWAVLSNLIDEVLQAPPGEKSFFYVGDVKQAIYNWRGGDHKLFMEIYGRYQNGQNPIECKNLSATYRCSEAVVQMVNKVFGNLPEWDRADQSINQSAYANALEEWQEVWTEHTSAFCTVGYACWIETINPKNQENPTDDNEDDTAAGDPIACEVFDRLYALKPWEKRLSCAIICRTNQRVDSLTRFLRAKEIPVAAESDIAFAASDPFSAALLSLFQATAHPGDTLAAEHLLLTPLRAWIESQPHLLDELAQLITYRGYAATIDFIIHSLRQIDFKLTAFVKDRLLLWRRFAAAYDANGARDTDAFLRYIRSCRIQEAPSANAVRILTIHKSKGLGFDCVLIPELHLPKSSHPAALLKGKNAQDKEWVCLGTNAALAEMIEPFKAATIAASAREWFEDFCNLYVALTRAKNALYIISSDRRKASGEASATRDALWLLESVFGTPKGGEREDFPRIRSEFGNSNWIRGLK